MYKSKTSDIQVNTIIKYRDIEFFESLFLNKRDTSENNRKRKIDDGFKRNKESEPRRKKTNVAKSFVPNFISFLIENKHLTFKKAMISPKFSF